MAIEQVTTAIANLMRTPPTSQQPAPPSVTVSIGAPGSAASTSDLTLFLYLIAPDAAQRNQERVRPFPSTTLPPQIETQVVRPAVPLELRYLVTPGSDGTGNSAGLGWLAHAVRVIECASPLSLGEPYFQPAIWLSLLPYETDELSRIWGLFPNVNCRSSIIFRAGPVWIDPLVNAPVAAPVQSDVARAGRRPEVA